jgi:hypothetical protein
MDGIVQNHRPKVSIVTCPLQKRSERVISEVHEGRFH